MHVKRVLCKQKKKMFLTKEKRTEILHSPIYYNSVTGKSKIVETIFVFGVWYHSETFGALKTAGLTSRILYNNSPGNT